MEQGTKDNEHGLAPMMKGQWSKDPDCGSQDSPHELRSANQCTKFTVCVHQGVGPVVRKSVTMDRPKGTYKRGRERERRDLGKWRAREVMKEGEEKRENNQCRGGRKLRRREAEGRGSWEERGEKEVEGSLLGTPLGKRLDSEDTKGCTRKESLQRP